MKTAICHNPHNLPNWRFLHR